MSFSGLFLRTPVTLPEGQFVNLKLNIGPGIVEAQGYVVWNVSSSQNQGYSGLGIRIDRIVSGRKLFERFVEQQHMGEIDGDVGPNQPMVRT